MVENIEYGWLKFNVCGIAKEDKAGCGEILRDLEGIARGIFSGAAGTNIAEEAEIEAVKIALEVLRGGVFLVYQQGAETLVCKVGSIVFSLVDRNGNHLTFSLALTGMLFNMELNFHLKCPLLLSLPFILCFT
ncbi:hypothetical protein PVK06_033326 [Gossypium arboreum]|uniref:RNase H type-1 domain-containing protein n=1 Tax=Gossypium arboreum TaxID=29729 RepID=A0ABR0NC06_GOSAR|nr:hypothetical protein PVK06_033326 [Gossypium arboreum]